MCTTGGACASISRPKGLPRELKQVIYSRKKSKWKELRCDVNKDSWGPENKVGVGLDGGHRGHSPSDSSLKGTEIRRGDLAQHYAI